MTIKKTKKCFGIAEKMANVDCGLKKGNFEEALLIIEPLVKALKREVNAQKRDEHKVYCCFRNKIEELTYYEIYADEREVVLIKEDFVSVFTCYSKFLFKQGKLLKAMEMTNIAYDLNPLNTDTLLLIAEYQKDEPMNLKKDINIICLFSAWKSKDIAKAYKNLAIKSQTAKMNDLAIALLYYSLKFDPENKETENELKGLLQKQNTESSSLDDMTSNHYLLKNRIPICPNPLILSMIQTLIFNEENPKMKEYYQDILHDIVRLDLKINQSNIVSPSFNSSQTIDEAKRYISKGSFHKALKTIETLTAKIEANGYQPVGGISDVPPPKYLSFTNKVEEILYQKTVFETGTRYVLTEDFVSVYQLYGFILTSLKDYKKAVTALEKALSLNPFSSDIHYDLAICFYKMKQDDDFETEMRLSLDYATDRASLVRVYFTLAKHNVKLYMLDKKESYKEIAVAFIYLCLFFMPDNKEMHKSLNLFAKELKLKPFDIDFKKINDLLDELDINIGLDLKISSIIIELFILAQKSKDSEAEKMYAQIIDEVVLLQELWVMLFTGDDTLDDFKSSVWHRLYHFGVEECVGEVISLMDKDKFKEAQKKIEPFVKKVEEADFFITPLNEDGTKLTRVKIKGREVRYLHFEDNLNEEIYKHKMNKMDNVLLIPEDYGWMYSIYGVLLMQLNKFEKVKTVYLKALSYDPFNPYTLLGFCEYYKVTAEWDEYLKLLKLCQEVLFTVEDLAQYYRCLGFYHIGQKNLDLAISLYNVSLHLDPESPIAKEEILLIKKIKGESQIKRNIKEYVEILRQNDIPLGINQSVIDIVTRLANEAHEYNDSNGIEYYDELLEGFKLCEIFLD